MSSCYYPRTSFVGTAFSQVWNGSVSIAVALAVPFATPVGTADLGDCRQ